MVVCLVLHVSIVCMCLGIGVCMVDVILFYCVLDLYDVLFEFVVLYCCICMIFRVF